MIKVVTSYKVLEIFDERSIEKGKKKKKKKKPRGGCLKFKAIYRRKTFLF